MNDFSFVQGHNPFIAFGLSLILTLFMATWEWFETKSKERVKQCVQTSVVGSIFIVSMFELIFILFPGLSKQLSA